MAFIFFSEIRPLSMAVRARTWSFQSLTPGLATETAWCALAISCLQALTSFWLSDGWDAGTSSG